MEQNKTVAEAMKENGSIIALYKKEIREAQAMLMAGEAVRCAISCIRYIDIAGEQPDTKRKTVDLNSGVLVLTDRRLFFRTASGYLNMELDIRALRSVEEFDDRSLRAMRIFTETKTLQFKEKRQGIAAMTRAINKALGIEMPPEVPKPQKAASQPKPRKFRAPTPAEIRCPNCGSLRHRVYRYPKSNPYFIRNSTILFLRLLLRLYTVFILEGKTLECCDCGHCWRP